MRIMGLDYGDKTIGVAISDPLLITAAGKEIIRRSDELAINKSLARLAELITQYEIGLIVLGYPKNMNSYAGERCVKTLAFRDKLTKRFNIRVELWDERLSTVAVSRVIASLSHERRRDVIDKLAAVYILQGYLDRLSNQKNECRGLQSNTVESFGNSVNEEAEKNMDEFEFEDDERIISFTDDDGGEIELIVVDAVLHEGVNYLLCVESNDDDNDEVEAYIFKELQGEAGAQGGSSESEETIISPVDDDDELERIMGLFGSDDYELTE